MGVAVKREWIEAAKAHGFKDEAIKADPIDTSELRELLVQVRTNLAKMRSKPYRASRAA